MPSPPSPFLFCCFVVLSFLSLQLCYYSNRRKLAYCESVRITFPGPSTLVNASTIFEGRQTISFSFRFVFSPPFLTQNARFGRLHKASINVAPSQWALRLSPVLAIFTLIQKFFHGAALLFEPGAVLQSINMLQLVFKDLNRQGRINQFMGRILIQSPVFLTTDFVHNFTRRNFV